GAGGSRHAMSVEAARILVVEDNRDTSALLRDLLEAEGYAVESSITGEHALEVLAQNPDVDLLVLDLMLPGMSGYEVIERLRSSSDLASIPVLVLSALSSISASEGVGSIAMATGAPVLIKDGAAADPRVTSRAVRALGIRSLMVAPLIVGGSAVGVLEVGRRTRQLDPRADRLLRIVADRVAVALEHARLEGEARELADVVRRIGEGVVVADADDRVTFA